MPKPLLKNYPVLVAGELKKWGFLRPGAWTRYRWPTVGGLTATLRCDGERLTVLVPTQTGEQSSAILVDHLQQHLGGTRAWLRCPCCDTRRSKLYINRNGLVAFRVCIGALHVSTRHRKPERAAMAAQQIRHRLGWSAAEPIIRTKPRAMHWATYERLVVEHDRLADEAVLGLVIMPYERLCRSCY